MKNPDNPRNPAAGLVRLADAPEAPECSDRAPDADASDRLRAHLIAEHGFEAAYFDEDYPDGGPIHDLSSLRWLHAPWVKTREYPKGCERL